MKALQFPLLYLLALQAIDCYPMINVTLNKNLIISDSGYWIGEEVKDKHLFDGKLASALVDFFHQAKAASIVDFGCGVGHYVKHFINAGIYCDGFDGNPAAPLLTEGLVKIIDLSKTFDLGRQYDWVLSLEVGEHIPLQFETIFIENLIRHTKIGIVLSWAIIGQEGVGHVNCQNNDYIKNKLSQYGFTSDIKSEKILRNAAKLPWFKNTVMVFYKNVN